MRLVSAGTTSVMKAVGQMEEIARRYIIVEMFRIIGKEKQKKPM
jgi:hypothetical protein